MPRIATRSTYRVPKRNRTARTTPSSRAALSPQQSLVLKHLQTFGHNGERRGLSPIEGLIHYRIACLHKRIGELKDLGYDIVTERRVDITKRAYCRYFLVSE